MRDYLTIGPTPADEDCQQVGTPEYSAEKARVECCAFIGQLRRQFGIEPEGARLAVKRFAHEFGTYHEVVCWYDDDNEAAAEYAFKCEGEADTLWDTEAMDEIAYLLAK